MANKIYTNHTLEEYNKKYGNKGLKKVNKIDADKDHKLLSGHSWWLIKDTYYQLPDNKGFKSWWSNLGKGGQIALCALLGAGVATAVVMPTVIAINNNKSADIGVDSIDKVDYKNNGYDKDGNAKCSIKGKDGNEIESLTITIENYVLQSNEYKYNKETGEVTIYKATLDAHKGKIQITPQFKGKDPEVIKVTSVEIKNTTTSVEVDGELELSVTVLPENATNKDLDWSIKDNSDIAEIIKKDNKYYLKGKSKGSVTVTATTKDGSGKSSSKSFNVIESASLDYVEIKGTNTCLVKAKGDKTLPDDVVIPEKDPKTNKTVVGITSNAFGKDLNVKTITFAKPDNITIISPYAFQNNNSLVSFEIPKNVEEIGGGAFSFYPGQAGTKSSLATITFESGSKLKKIGNLAFINQWELKSINIPSTVEFIGQDAFYATGLTSAKFGDTTNCWLFNYSEIWTPSDTTTNAKKLKDNCYTGIVKNTINISGESSVEEKDTITLSVPGGITVDAWGSSDTSKATVEDGVVTGVAAGDCYIYVIAEEGTKVGIKKITVNKKVTTKADFIKAYKDLRTKFNTETTRTYKPSQIKVKSWGGDGFANIKSLSDLTYDTTSNRSCIFKFKDDDGNEQFHEFGTNYLSDTELDSLLKAETESSVTYTIDDDYIEYIYDDPFTPGLQELKINKYGYIVGYSKYSGGKYDEFTLSINGETDTYYNIDWVTTKFDLPGDGTQKTLYEYAKHATKIEFVESDDTESGVCVGEGSGEGQQPVYASFTTVDEEEILKVWSAGKIRFEDDDKPKSLEGFFYNCDCVTSFDFSNIDTSYVTDFSWCFYNCANVEELNLTNFDTYSAINMGSMFQEDYELKSVDVSSFNTSNVTDMNYMFYKCNTLTNLDLSSFVTSKVTKMYNMFCNCYSLESVNVSSFDTSSVVDMCSMFSSCESLKTLDVSNFDTSSVEDMSDMFCWCFSLKTLDLTSFNTEKVTNMSEMFKQENEDGHDNELTTIYVGENFSTELVTSGDDVDMFSGCTHLVGGNGTQWTEDKPVDKTYAKIDKEGQPGYFTDSSEKPTLNKLGFEIIGEESDKTVSVFAALTTYGSIAGNIVIPSYIDGKYVHKEEGDNYKVTTIPETAFWWCDEITSVIIPDTIVSIGNLAFANCTSLTSFTYKGTTYKFQEMLNKGQISPNWKENSSFNVVHCIDGDLQL